MVQGGQAGSRHPVDGRLCVRTQLLTTCGCCCRAPQLLLPPCCPPTLASAPCCCSDGAPRRHEEPQRVLTLDDLFKKTASKPCIYWLPLTGEI